MKQTGIIMSGDHPKLILDGTKTMTRRVIKLPNAPNHLGDWEATYLGGDDSTRDSRGVLVPRIDGIWHTRTGKFIKCPYGQVGDRLWVRETWCVSSEWDKLPPAKLPFKARKTTIYKADGFERTGRWRSSRFIPRWASRINLEITGLRVERVQEITEEDARAEGIKITQGTWQATERDLDTGRLGLVGEPQPYTARYHFEALWDSLNAKRGYGWEANLWVWVIEFKLANSEVG